MHRLKSSRTFTPDKGLQRALDAVGGYRALGRKLGIRHSAIMQWKKVPAERLIEIERVTHVPRELLRPDLYRKAAVAERSLSDIDQELAEFP